MGKNENLHKTKDAKNDEFYSCNVAECAIHRALSEPVLAAKQRTV